MNTVPKVAGRHFHIAVFGLGLLLSHHGLFAAVDVQPLNVTRSPSSVAPGASLAVSWQIRNNGSTVAASSQSQVRITASSSSWGNSGNNVGSAVATGTIGAGATINQNSTVTVPSLAPGTYYVWVVADNTSVLTQSSVNNDYAVSASFTITGGTVDVQPLNVTRGSSSVAPGASLSVSWQIRNNGSASAATSQSQVRITASSSSWGNSGNNVGSAVATGTIGAGATINQNTTLTVPSLAPGTYYVWVVADNTSVLSQSNTGNDYAVSSSFTITGTLDVQPLNVTRGSSSAAPGDLLAVDWQIRNNGSASAATSQSQVRITASSSSWGNSGNNVGTAVATGTIGAGATINQNTTVTVPSLAPGTYYVWVVADNTSVLTQSNVNNDYAVSASFTITGGTVDVQPLSVTRGSSSVAPGASLSVSWQIRNNGSASAASSQSQVRITASSSSWGNSANNVGTGVATGTIGAGATINQNTTVTVPSLAPGTYYVWVVADNTSVLTQSNVNNDYAVSSSFTIPGGTVDVEPLSVTRSPNSVAPGDSLSVSWQIRNNGSASAASSQSQVRISSSSSNSGGPASNVGSAVATGTIPAGTTINQSKTVTAPSTPGTYYVWVVADNTTVLTQSDVNNDFAVSTPFTVEGTNGKPLFQVPFSCGETWYAYTHSGHTERNEWALDFNKSPVAGGSPSGLGEPVLASASGQVSRLNKTDPNIPNGIFIEIDHGSGWHTIYLHLQEDSIPAPLEIGSSIVAGQSIGKLGTTGDSTGPHLHYDQRLGAFPEFQSYPIEFNGQPIQYVQHPDRVPIVSANCASSVDVQPLNVTCSPRIVASGGSLSVSWQIRNNGSASAASSQSQVRISSSSSNSGGPASNVGSAVATGTIPAGTTINQNETVTVPSTPGTYYIWVVADNTTVLTQSDVNNDFAVSTSFTVGPSQQGEPAILGVVWLPSPNFEDRPPDQVIDSIVLHTVEGSYESGIATLTDNSRPLAQRVSAHYVISASGEITQLVDLSKRAWHATYYNDRSIGIEMAGFAAQASTWNALNLTTLENLVAYLVTKYEIAVVHPSGDAGTYPQCRFTEIGLIAHSQLQPGCNEFATKNDPGPHFPWSTFLKNVQAKVNAPRITGIGGGGLQPPSNGQFQFEVAAPTLPQVIVQVADVPSGPWSDYKTVTITQGKGIFNDEDAGIHTRRFYRPKP